MTFKTLSREEFDKFVHIYNTKSIYQTIEYASIMEKQDFKCVFFGLVEEDIIQAATMIMIKKINGYNYAFAPRGFLIDYNNLKMLEKFTAGVKKQLSKMGVVAVRLSPLLIRSITDPKRNITKTNPLYDSSKENLKKCGFNHMGYNDFFEASKPRFEAILDLNEQYPVLFSRIKKEFRNKIRNSEKMGIRIYKGNQNDLKYLYFQIKKSYARDLSFFQSCYYFYKQRNMIDFYYAKIDTRIYLEKAQQDYMKQEKISTEIESEIINPNLVNTQKMITRKIENDKRLNLCSNRIVQATNLLRDKPEGVVIASILVVKHQNTVDLLLDGYDPNFKNINGKHLLIWKLIEKYSKLGYRYFNLGGITNIQKENKRYAGLNEFKLNFGSNIVEYVGDLELVTNQALYFMYKKRKK